MRSAWAVLGLVALGAIAPGCAAAPPTHTQVITPRDAAVAGYRRAYVNAMPSVLARLAEADARIAARAGFSVGGDPFLTDARAEGLRSARGELARMEIPLDSPYAADPEIVDLLAVQAAARALLDEEDLRLEWERNYAGHAADVLRGAQLYVDTQATVEDPDELLAWRVAIVKDALKPNTISRWEQLELGAWLRDLAPARRGAKTTAAAAQLDKHLANLPVAPYAVRTEEELDHGVATFFGLPASFDAVEPWTERAAGALRAQLEVAFGVLSPAAAEEVRAKAAALLARPPQCAPRLPVQDARHLAPPPERARACALVRALAVAATDSDELAALLALHEATVTGGRAATMHGKTRDPAAAARRWPRLLALSEEAEARETLYAATHPVAAIAPAAEAGVLVEAGVARARERAREWMRFGEAPPIVIDRHLATRPRSAPLNAPGGAPRPAPRR